MEGSPNSFGGWTWWFLTAVILAVVVNLASDYLKPKLDRYLEGYSTSRRIANEKKRQKFEQGVERLLNDPTAVSILLYRSLGLLVLFVSAMGLSMLLWIIAAFFILLPVGHGLYSSVLSLVLAALFVILSFISWGLWREKTRLLQAYEKAKRERATGYSTDAGSADEQEATKEPS